MFALQWLSIFYGEDLRAEASKGRSENFMRLAYTLLCNGAFSQANTTCFCQERHQEERAKNIRAIFKERPLKNHRRWLWSCLLELGHTQYVLPKMATRSQAIYLTFFYHINRITLTVRRIALKFRMR